MQKNILIFHTAFIGDIVLSTPLIKNIKKLYPDSKIVYVTTPAGRAVLANNPFLDEVIAYDKRGKDKGIKGMFGLIRGLRKHKFDIAYVPHRYMRSSLIVFLSKIPQRIGFDISEGKLFLTKKIKYEKNLHEVDRLLKLLEIEILDKKIELYPSEKDEKHIDELFENEDLQGKKLVAIAIGSKWYTKRWPVEYFNVLIEQLEKREDIKLILIGGNEEKDLPVVYSEKTINAIGKTSLLELAELIKRCEICLTNDSSPIHIASAFDTYILAIFGATVKDLGFYPWGENSEVIENKGLYCRPCGLHGGETCPEGHFKCMLEINPELVYKKVIKILETRDLR